MEFFSPILIWGKAPVFYYIDNAAAGQKKKKKIKMALSSFSHFIFNFT